MTRTARCQRFRWSRKTYKHAHQLSRLLARYMDLPDHPPAIVRRYWELWELQRAAHAEPDPLETPLRLRLEAHKGGDDWIPF